MNWLLAAGRSSIGKKTMMAASGMGLSLFLALHLLGVATILGGRASFTAYAAHLQALGPLLPLLEAGLAGLFIFHPCLGLYLAWENRQARPRGYALRQRTSGHGWGARIMPYSGAAILVFLLVHLLNFRLAPTVTPLAVLVRETLGQPRIALFYLLAMAALILHTSHGFWSLGQTLGINHPKYNGFWHRAARVVSFLAGGTFALIPLLALCSNQFLR